MSVLQKMVLVAALGALPAELLAQTVVVDAANPQGTLPHYERYGSTIYNSRGALDQQLMKDVGMSIERTFYVLPGVCTAEGVYDFAWNGSGFYGSDQMLDNIISHGAQPLVDLVGVPAWLSVTGIRNGRPSDWTKWETMIRDILNHLRQRYPGLQYVDLFNESFSPWGDTAAGTEGWYWDAYSHTSNAVKAVNTIGGHFKLGGPVCDHDQVNVCTQLMDSAQSRGAQLDFISYHVYSGNPSDAPSIALQIQSAAQSRGLDLLQFITEWGSTTWTDATVGNTADAAAYIATAWQLFAQTGLGERVRPMWFALYNYAQPSLSVLAYNHPDGTVNPAYNVSKMFSLMKNTLLATSGNSLASTDGTTVTIMVVGGATVTVNNLPANFLGGVRYQRYLIDNLHSNYLFDSSNDKLQQVGDTQLSGGASATVTVDTSGSGVNLIVLTGGSGGPLPPTITVQPADQTVTVGQTATFSVTATGTAPLSYQWQESTDGGATWSPVGTNSSSYTTAATTVGESGAKFQVVVTNSAGSVTSSSATLTVTSSGGGSLPPPWVDQDVGSPGISGSATYDASSGTFTVSGSGADIWGTADSFHFAYQTLNGDGTIIARVTGQGNTDPWAKAGVMIRETLDPGSTFSDMVVTPGNGTAFQGRDHTGGPATSAGGPILGLPTWVMIARAGNTFVGSVSADGTNWTAVGTVTIPMTPQVYIGLAVTSHNNATVSTAMFDSVTGGGGWSYPSPPAGATASPGVSHCGSVGVDLLAPLGFLWLARKGLRRRNSLRSALKRERANPGNP
jgi:hypothetical protein